MFVIHRQQAIMPNHCSSSNNLFINFYGIAAPAMPFGCSASLHSLSCCLQFRFIPHGSYCVLHATLFITSFVPLHYTSFAAIPFATSLCCPFQPTYLLTRAASAFSQTSPTILTGFHYATLCHSFTSVAFSPPAANNLARLRYPLRLRSLKCCPIH